MNPRTATPASVYWAPCRSSERQLAMNEVSLLSRLDHPHIISYYDSFEEDGGQFSKFILAFEMGVDLSAHDRNGIC